MVDKLHEYQGLVGRIHTWRDCAKARWIAWRERRGLSSKKPALQEDYAHVYRKKTCRELVRVSAAVMGIEFSYAAETAFVSPQLLKIGVEHRLMTLVWALSPLVGFFVTPVLGSLSDRCRLKWGRRRPFIALLALGVLIGLLLVPNGEDIGYALGDVYQPHKSLDEPRRDNATSTQVPPTADPQPFTRTWGVVFTILGTVLLDFDADACQSPARAYLLDVTIPDDHARGLSTFTIMAGLGGFLGYALGGINWDATALGALLGGHVRAVFTLITFIFVLCVTYTITSFREVPLDIVEQEHIDNEVTGSSPGSEKLPPTLGDTDGCYGAVDNDETVHQQTQTKAREEYKSIDGQNTVENGYINYGCDDSYHQQTLVETSFNKSEAKELSQKSPSSNSGPATLGQYLLSIVYMPSSLRILCLTNLFCWMAHVCYSLYFTDFVGEAVFQGDPQADENSVTRELYEEGVRFGCWGMSMYSLSCACYSFVIERLINRFKARRVYVGGLLFYSTGMLLMALTKHRVGVIVFSWTAGVMYSTLFTLPYLLVAHYHALGTFEVTAEGEAKVGSQVRGLGTDVAIVSSMVFLAQFILSVCMGTIVSLAGTTTAVVSVASFLSLCGAVVAMRVMYLDL